LILLYHILSANNGLIEM